MCANVLKKRDNATHEVAAIDIFGVFDAWIGEKCVTSRS